MGLPGRRRREVGKTAVWTFPGWEIQRRVAGERGAIFMRCSRIERQDSRRKKNHMKEADGGCLIVSERRKFQRRMRRGSKGRKRAEDYVGIPD